MSTTYDDPNREAVGLAPIWSGAGAAEPPPEGEVQATKSKSRKGKAEAEAEQHEQHEQHERPGAEFQHAGHARSRLAGCQLLGQEAQFLTSRPSVCSNENPASRGFLFLEIAIVATTACCAAPCVSQS